MYPEQTLLPSSPVARELWEVVAAVERRCSTDCSYEEGPGIQSDGAFDKGDRQRAGCRIVVERHVCSDRGSAIPTGVEPGHSKVGGRVGRQVDGLCARIVNCR